MKQIIASVFSDIYTIGNTIFCTFKFNRYDCKGIQASACRSKHPFLLNLINIFARVYKLRLAEVNFLSC